MSASELDIIQLRENLEKFQLDKIFVESLGWEYPTNQTSGTVEIKGNAIFYSHIAEKNGVPILHFDQKIFNQLDSTLNKKKFHQKIKQQHNKHIILFSDKKNSLSLSYLSKEGQVRDHHSYFKGQNGDDFIGKLASIHFGIEDEPKISEIGEKLQKAFDTEKVTKKFFEDFKSNHFNFQKYILGIKDKEDKKWYASLILNRLMFIWFLQKKGFVNNDFDYLQTKLTESKKRGKDRYQSEFLQLLFFEGFAKKSIERSDRAKKLIGKIKYLNGGLFVPHSIEEKYKDKIKIRDKAFDETFKIFNQYEWHLHDSKGNGNEISPDVMGYIFEKYINELQQKSLGAYYTRDEITKYLSRNTIENCILDKVNQKDYSFESMTELLHKLDASLCKFLLTDKDSILNTLTILDPAVGSGAFLVSAMKELTDIYSPIICKIEALGADRKLNQWIKDFKSEYKSIPYGIKKNIILKNLYGVDIMKEATEVCKLRFFLSLVSSALDKDELEPLPNMDFNIIHGNSLVGFLKKENVNEQLSLFGESYQQLKDKYNKLVSQYKNKPLSFEKLKELKSKINEFLKENNSNLNRVLADKCNEKGLRYRLITDIQSKKKMFEKRDVLSDDFSNEIDARNLNPFHWDFNFNEIINKGGFDVLITNPPWEKVKFEEREFFAKYDDSIDKKKASKEIVRKKSKVLLKIPKVKEDYLKTKELCQFQRDYFSTLYQYQSGKISNNDGTEKKASADMDMYRLFTERCFELLGENGFLGIVIPSGLHKDDGSVGLRTELLFKRAKIEGLIDFQNQMSNGKGKIFEGVHSSFKFLLLNLKKDKPQDKFPCQFDERDLKVLETFPKNATKQSITEIKELSPRDCSIIEFKNPKDKAILKKSRQFPKLEETVESAWKPHFYNEFHETNDSHLFKDKKLSVDFLPLYKGKAIHQYEFNHDLSSVNRYVHENSKKVKEGKGFSFKNSCYKDYRLVIRSIARSTDERSLISAVIPKNHFITNSLCGVDIDLNDLQKSQPVRLQEAIPLKKKYMLLTQAFLNSFVVDYFIRKKVSANINKKYIISLHIPRLTEKDDYFNELVERSAQLTCIGEEFDELADEVGVPRGQAYDQQERWKMQGEIDAMVAYIYGLNLDEFEYILSTFTTGKNQERLEILKKYAMETLEKNQFFKKTG